MSQSLEIKNRKAYFDYHIDEKYVAGIKLTGTEIKSIRNGKASVTESFCYFNSYELFVKNMHIAEYEKGGYTNHEPRRDRKLLLQKKELLKLFRKVKEKGFTIIPLQLFINDKGLAKLEIGLAKGKKEYDKRETLKLKDHKREMDRAKKK
jgi:SsrA-binding protein